MARVATLGLALGLLAILSAPVAVTAGSARAAAAAAANPDVAIAFDAPAPGSVLSGFTLIEGWAADLDPAGVGIDANNLQVWLGGGDGTPLGFATYGWPRDDVAARLGSPRYARTGFRLGWEVCTFPTGDYHLVAFGWRQDTDDVGLAETRVRVDGCTTPAGGELLADALADERSLWLRGASDECQFAFVGGAYHARKLAAARAEDCAGWDNDSTVFADFVAEVDVRLLDPTPDRFATIAFRHGVAEYSARYRAGYSVHLYPARGLVRLVYDRGREYTPLAEVRSPALRGGEAMDRVRVAAVGSRLQVAVNGQDVLTFDDDRQPWGLLALGAGAPLGQEAEAAYQHLVVRRP